MSFWNLSDNTVAQPVTEFAQEGGKPQLFVDGATLTAFADEAKWSKHYGTEDEYISIRWRVMAPQSAANRVIFQKLDVRGHDPKVKGDKDKSDRKADNAKRMLMAINGNAGSQLPMDREPTDADLQSCLLNKAMNIRMGLWTLKGDDGVTKKGNYVQAVSPRGNVDEVSYVKENESQQQPQPVAQAQGSVVTSDSIPF